MKGLLADIWFPIAFTTAVASALTGGTEAKFVQLVEDGLIDLSQPVYLMVSGHSNSLAASLEILSYVRQHQGGRQSDDERGRYRSGDQ